MQISASLFISKKAYIIYKYPRWNIERSDIKVLDTMDIMAVQVWQILLYTLSQSVINSIRDKEINILVEKLPTDKEISIHTSYLELNTPKFSFNFPTFQRLLRISNKIKTSHWNWGLFIFYLSLAPPSPPSNRQRNLYLLGLNAIQFSFFTFQPLLWIIRSELPVGIGILPSPLLSLVPITWRDFSRILVNVHRLSMIEQQEKKKSRSVSKVYSILASSSSSPACTKD